MTIGDAAAFCAGLVFLVGAWAKLRHRATLSGVVANYRLLPPIAVAPVAAILPWLEGAVGLALLLGERRWVPIVAAVLLLAFAAAIGINIRRGRSHIDCGCGVGGLRQSLHGALVVRNLMMAIALSFNLLAGTLPVMERIAAMATGLTLFLLILLLNALLALPGFRPQPA
ncbi:MauE/DoxX family redox-associated membrane protein [Sphingomonas bacterium]|uniref:MauE/DoxX family redox-associated membrane protein n=1 Tax=Sphingomonas bacterium TaxID=1895847 RepID=UPI0020C721DC|nr:MauE/DoxX family redox-associated membrane protein [Sphingomonas bacterium]